MDNRYKGTVDHPFHLSVGAVLFDDNGKVACHYFDKFEYKPDWISLEDFYLLMRETLHDNESMEEALVRGIREEFGATGEIISYIGSIQSQFKRGDSPIEKTTLYFLMKLKQIDLNLRDKDDEEKMSVIQLQPIDFLIHRMKAQGEKYERTDIDESMILERAKKFIKL